MDVIRAARAIAGLLSVFTLLGLFVLSFYLERAIPPNMTHTLLAVIGILLGVDMLAQRLDLPLNITITAGDGDDTNEGER